MDSQQGTIIIHRGNTLNPNEPISEKGSMPIFPIDITKKVEIHNNISNTRGEVQFVPKSPLAPQGFGHKRNGSFLITTFRFVVGC